MNKKHHAGLFRRHGRLILSLTVLSLLLMVMLPQTDALWRSLIIVGQARPVPVVAALFLTALTYALSGEIYHMLLKHPIRLRTIMLVQTATALTSRVVPIGIGTMGLNAYFLRRQNHRLSEALAVVAANNLIGVAGHLILLGIALLSVPLPDNLGVELSWTLLYWLLLAVTITVACLTLSSRLRRRMIAAWSSLLKAFTSYRHQPWLLVRALLTSMMLSLVYVLALAACCLALGAPLPLDKLFLIYTFSLLTGAATPTPGGLVGVEAGLIAGLVSYGIRVDIALAVALLYRLVTYWLPLIPGFIAFRVVQHRYL